MRYCSSLLCKVVKYFWVITKLVLHPLGIEPGPPTWLVQVRLPPISFTVNIGVNGLRYV
jgi:hypothetical protein